MTVWVIYLERDGDTELMLLPDKQVLAVAGDELQKSLTEIQQLGIGAFAVMRGKG